MYLGNFKAGSTVRRKFNTEDPTGAGITLAGTPVISVYKNGNAASEVTTGVTLTVDFDGKTGLHLLTVDMSADGSFYSAGAEFMAVLTAGTVNGISKVGTVVAQWGVQNRHSVLDDTMTSFTSPGTLGQRLQSVLSGTLSAGGASSVTLPVGASAVNDYYKDRVIFITGGSGAGQGATITAYDGATRVATAGFTTAPDATSTFVILPTGTGEALLTPADVTDAVLNETVPGAFGAGSVGNILGNRLDVAVSSRSNHTVADVWNHATRTLSSFGTLVSDIWSHATRILTAGTNIALTKGVGLLGLNDLSAAQVNAEVDTALTDYDGVVPADVAGLATTAQLAAAVAPLATSAEVATKAEPGDAMTLTSGERDAIAAAHLDLADGVETGLTPREAQRLSAAALFGRVSGAGTGTVVFRDVNNTVNRISATVDDDGNRTSVTTNPN